MLHDDILTFRVVGSDQATATVMKGLKLDLSQCVTLAIYHSRSRGLLLWLEAFPGENPNKTPCKSKMDLVVAAVQNLGEQLANALNSKHEAEWMEKEETHTGRV